MGVNTTEMKGEEERRGGGEGRRGRGMGEGEEGERRGRGEEGKR